MKMKKLFLLMLISVVCLAFLSAPVFAKGEKEKTATVIGSIQGLGCVIENKVCPIGQEAAMAAISDVLVLLVDAAKADYYVIPNVDMKVLARLINEQVTVRGYVDKKHNSIWAEEIANGKTIVWNQKMQDELRKKMARQAK
jgi:hypothetical protein